MIAVAAAVSDQSTGGDSTGRNGRKSPWQTGRVTPPNGIYHTGSVRSPYEKKVIERGLTHLKRRGRDGGISHGTIIVVVGTFGAVLRRTQFVVTMRELSWSANGVFYGDT